MADQNLEAVWVKILRTLRENKRFALFGLLSNMDDVAMRDGQIFMHTHNEAEKKMLKQYLKTLQEMAGTAVQLVVEDNTVVVQDDNQEYVTRLKEIFGDKVEIV
ncbi:MAG: hypothetical protein IJ295_02040 [Clostridia bacterium]|nr:hypothetical protein [Clostridia bacterium]